MTLDDAIKDYLRHIRFEKGLSPVTHAHYQSRLHNLQNWLKENGYTDPGIDVLTAPALRRYLYAMAAKNLRPRTVRGYFHAIRGLCAFLVEAGGLSENPSKGIALPKLDAARRLTVSDEEITLLLEACERQRFPRQVALSRAILSVFVNGGLRRQELCDLQVEDFNLNEKSLLVRCGKGSKSRKVFLCDPCVTALREWLAHREEDTRHDFLFSLDRNRRLNHAGIASFVETVKAIAGFAGKENIKPHSLRHACATRLMRNGADLRSIQAFLGHSSLTVTAQYLHTDEQQLKNIASLAAIHKLSVQQDTPTSPVRYRPYRRR